MVTKKIIQKDKKGRVMTYDIGANAPNVTEDETHRFVTDDEKKEWGNKAADTVFAGANGSAAGQKGLVPKPDAVDYDKYLRGNGTWGSVDDMAPTFTPAVSRENIKSGEKNLTLFGKIAKFFSDLKAHAFSAPVNNGTSTSTTLALAASMGKTLMDKITKNANDISSLNSKKDIEYTKDPVVSFTNLSVRAANNVVSCHGVIRTAYIGVESRIIFIDAAYKPPYLTHFVWATPDGKSGTGYVDTNGTMIFDTSKLSGINDLYVGFSYIL